MFNNDAEYASSRMQQSWFSTTTKGDLDLFYVQKLIMDPGNSFDKSLVVGSTVEGFASGTTITVPSNLFNYSFGKLGYVETLSDGEYSYWMRMPVRRNIKQGIRSDLIAFTKNGRESGLSEARFRSGLNGLRKCIRGQYFFFPVALEAVEEEDRTIAFSNKFAVTSKFKIEYKGELVGKVTKDDRVQLDQKYEFLQEELGQVIGYDKLA